MNARIVVSIALLAITATATHASDSSPAWQTPGYVMEEVVVTAPAIRALPAWQTPGYIMEEVVVTASRSEILARESADRPVLLLALHEAHEAEAAQWRARTDIATTDPH